MEFAKELSKVDQIICRSCNKEVKFNKVDGFNPVLAGKICKNMKTKEVWVICWNCLRAIKTKLIKGKKNVK